MLITRFSEKSRFQLWLLGIVLIGVLLAQLLYRGLPIQTDLLAMLPASERDPVAALALKQLEKNIGERSVLLVGAADAPQAIAAAQTAATSLQQSKAFAEVLFQRQAGDTLASAKAMRYALADAASLQSLQQQGLSAWLAEHAAQLYGPLGAPRAALLSQDPLFLAGEVLARKMENGVDFDPVSSVVLLHGEGRVWALIEAKNRSKAFSEEGPKAIKSALENAKAAALSQNPSANVLMTSVALHAAKASEQAKGEISRIGIGSWLGSILLIWLAFRRVSAVVMCVVPLGVATAAAIVATSYLMGSIHVLTLVFGASLIGVAIDYGTHCFADSLGADQKWTMRHAVTELRPALFYGMLTSVTGYLALAIAPFPGLREIAVFSSTGLVAAYLTVILAFPTLLQHYQPKTRGIALADFFIKLHSHIPHKKWLLLLLIPLGIGLFQLRANDDLRSFHHIDPQLGAMETRIKTLFSRAPENQFYLVEGRSPDEVLQREASLLKALQAPLAQHQLSAVRAISQSIPASSAQAQTIAALQQALAAPEYTAWLRDLGVSEAAIAQDQAALKAAKPVSLAAWFASPLGASDQMLWLGKTQRGYASIVLLSGIKNKAALAAVQLAGVSWVDRVADISDLMARYRNIALVLTASALVLMLMLLAPRHGWRGASWIVLPSVFAATGSLALFGLLGIELNLFAAFALLLVLALGIDYAIFFRESGSNSRPAMLGVALDSSTTLLSFGLLAMSSLPAARSFGLMLLFGITLAFIFAPMARVTKPSSTKCTKKSNSMFECME